MKKRTWLIMHRREKALSQTEVAKAINISQQMYSCIEIGKKNPSVQTAKEIARLLDFDWTKFY